MLLFWLKKVDTSWAPAGGNRRCLFPVERNHVGIIGVVENNMLLISDIISITQVTGRGELLGSMSLF